MPCFCLGAKVDLKHWTSAQELKEGERPRVDVFVSMPFSFFFFSFFAPKCLGNLNGTVNQGPPHPFPLFHAFFFFLHAWSPVSSNMTGQELNWAEKSGADHQRVKVCFFIIIVASSVFS